MKRIEKTNSVVSSSAFSPENEAYPWLEEKVYAKLRQRTIDLVKCGIDTLLKEKQRVSLSTVAAKLKELDPEHRGISESAILDNQEARCIGYLGHPFVKEAPWAFITLRFLFVRWYSAIDRGGEWFSCTRENRRGWAADHQGWHAKAAGEVFGRPLHTRHYQLDGPLPPAGLSNTWSGFRLPSGSHGAAHP